MLFATSLKIEDKKGELKCELGRGRFLLLCCLNIAKGELSHRNFLQVEVEVVFSARGDKRKEIYFYQPDEEKKYMVSDVGEKS